MALLPGSTSVLPRTSAGGVAHSGSDLVECTPLLCPHASIVSDAFLSGDAEQQMLVNRAPFVGDGGSVVI